LASHSPEDDIGAELFIDSNSTIPIMVFRGGLDGAVTAPTSWLNQAVKEYARLNINDASVGLNRWFIPRGQDLAFLLSCIGLLGLEQR
jgi:hypothetical protein